MAACWGFSADLLPSSGVKKGEIFVQLLFAATILLSAALMFTVEFMFAKLVLPKLGGSPSVWNTCLVFYQAALMAGYIYAHLSLKWLGARWQSLLHIVLLCVACTCLPIGLAHGWTPPPGTNPIPWLLMLLTVCVGLPFFCISASAPLLQAWFTQFGGRSAKDPYFLYAASNLGSLIGLAAYPLLIEPRMSLEAQTKWWSAGYGLLVALFGVCATAAWIAVRRKALVVEPSAADAAEDSDQSEREGSLPAGFDTPVTPLRRLWWLALALVPSALLMGVTTHLTVDMPSMPLIWAIPLGLYLLSFIAVFARWPILKWLWLLRFFQAAGIAAAAATVYVESMETKFVILLGVVHLAAFFLTALVCHGAMAADRPASKHLTEFYLWMSAGGVVGGLLCALVAPLVFNSVMEYPLMLVAACLLRPLPRGSRHERLWRWADLALMMMQGCLFAFVVYAIPHRRLAHVAANWNSKPLETFVENITGSDACICWIVVATALAFLLQRRRAWFAVAVATLLGVCLICGGPEHTIYARRSFFGVLHVDRRNDGDIVIHRLMHGSTMHGEQSRDPDDALEPCTYYCPSGPVGDVFKARKQNKHFLHHGHIGVVGLGTGTVAAYAEPGQSLTYFEIDAAVREISTNPDYFTYLTNCKVEPRIRMGDARLTLELEPDNDYDLLVIDAFSSDAIPVHLLTREAMAMYLKKLAPGGLLLVHLSNRHLKLEPVVAGAADALGVVARLRDDEDETEDFDKSRSTWAVVANKEEDLGTLSENKDWEPLKPTPGLRPWTDDYSSIVSVMNWEWEWLWDWLPELWRKWKAN